MTERLSTIIKDQLVPAGEGLGANPRMLRINFNIETPVSTWRRPNPPVPAVGTERRVTQLGEFRTLFDGDFAPILDLQYSVTVNWFAKLATFVADFLMAYPPVVTGLPLEMGEVVNRDLSDAVYRVLVDQCRYGTGLLRAYNDGGQPRIGNVNPEGWYPGGRGEHAVVLPGALVEGRATTTVAILQPGRTTALLFTHQASGAEQADPEGMSYGAVLDRMLAETPVDHRNYVGPTLFPCPREPAHGGWGRSMFPDMVPLVAEYCKRLSKTADILDRHANPILAYTRDARQGPYDDSAPEAVRGAQIGARQMFLDQQRTVPQMVLPPELKDPRYLVWDAQMQSTEMFLRKLENALYETTAVPAALIASGKDGVAAIAGDNSLRKVYAKTYALMLRTQDQITFRIREAVKAALALANRRATFEVEWPNILREIDTQTMMNLGGQDASLLLPDAPGGRSAGAAGGDAADAGRPVRGSGDD